MNVVADDRPFVTSTGIVDLFGRTQYSAGRFRNQQTGRYDRRKRSEINTSPERLTVAVLGLCVCKRPETFTQTVVRS